MNCERFERLIALSIEGDLPNHRARRLEQHLASCLACREFAEGLKPSQSALKSLSRESVSETVFPELRQRVLNEIAAGGVRQKAAWMSVFPSWRWQIGLAGAAIALLAVVAVFLFSPEAPEPPAAQGPTEPFKSIAPVQEAAPSIPVRPLLGQAGVRRSISEAAGTNQRSLDKTHIEALHPDFTPLPIESLIIEPVKIEPPAASDEIVVKLVTDDPAVVIYWLIDQTGE